MRQLRIVVLGDWDNYMSYFLYGALEGIIRCGHIARPVPLFNSTLEDIKEQIVWFKPHILLCHMIFGCSHQHSQERVLNMLSDVRKKYNIFICYHNGDARVNPRYRGDISQWVDLGLLNQSNLDYYSSIWKIPVIRWPYMCLYQPRIADPVNIFKCRVAFTGELNLQGVHSERTRFVQELKRMGVDIKIFPTPESGNTRFQTAELAASADTVLGMQMERGLNGYTDVRPWQYIGAGAIYLHDSCSQIKEFFVPGDHYLEYDKDDPSSICRILEYLDERPIPSSVRHHGFQYCQAEHSTKERVESIINKYWEMRE